MANVGRYWRTVRYLHPSQVAHRVRLRGNRLVLRHQPDLVRRLYARPPRRAVGWPADFVPLDARCDEAYPSADANADGWFEFLGHRRALGTADPWHPQGVTQLWGYHLHYLEWLWAFHRHEDREWAQHEARALVSSWLDGTVYGRWDEWSPYVVSLRTWVLCGVFDSLMSGGPDAARVLAALQCHLEHLRHNVELDVGGNHLIKNLKALIGAAVFFDDQRTLAWALRLLGKQVEVQVLPDGGHFELSPSYHCQVLGDLMDVESLLSLANGAAPSSLTDAVGRMQRWLAEMLGPDGTVPNLGDSWPVSALRVRELRGRAECTGERLSVLADSGYIVARTRRLHLIADVGHPCPDSLPAHAQADCLNFVLWVDGRLAVEDPGTTAYVGPQRAHERSTIAHNTVEIDGLDQTEVWGSFRAGRRARPTGVAACDRGASIEIEASHTGYLHLPGSPLHHRRWSLTDDALDVHDRISGTGMHTVQHNLNLVADAPVRLTASAPTIGQVQLPVDLSVRIAAAAPSHWAPEVGAPAAPARGA